MDTNEIDKTRRRLEKRRKRRNVSFTSPSISRRPGMKKKELQFWQGSKQDDSLYLKISDNNSSSTSSLKQSDTIEANSKEHLVRYKIVGGMDHNAIIVYFDRDKLDAEKHGIQWVGLLTFTGFQFKYIDSNKKKVVFALADEDAYQYCDKNPCEECAFKCKNGFRIYIYCEKHGIFWTEVSPRSVINP